MNKTLLTMVAITAALPLTAVAQATAANSSVTVYGRLDVSVNHLRYGGTSAAPSGSATYVSSDSSQLGFRGTEDLGGGMRAYFKLEHWFNADTGAQFNPAQFWSREAYVGAGDASFGSIQLGSQYAPALWVSVKSDPFFRANSGAIFTLLQQSPSNLRGFVAGVNNSVQYISPTLGGVTGRVMIGASEGTTPGRSEHASVEYAADRLFVGVSYDQTKITGAAGGTPSVAVVSNKTFTAGATYRFDFAKLHAYYMQSNLEFQPKVNGYMVGTTVPVGAGDIRASWTTRNARDAANSDVTLLAAGYFHALSKRTSVYGVVSRVSNDGNARVNLWPASVDAGAALPRAGESVTGLQAGIRHLF